MGITEKPTADGSPGFAMTSPCPILAPQPFSSCCIGSAGHRTTTTTTGLPAPQTWGASAHSHPSLTRSQSVPATTGLVAPLQKDSISSTLAGMQDTRWGSPTSLEGELGAVAIFHEALPEASLRALCALGMHPFPQPIPCLLPQELGGPQARNKVQEGRGRPREVTTLGACRRPSQI